MTFLIISVVLAIAATVLSLIYIVPASKRDSLPTVGKIWHEILNIRNLLLEKIYHTLYVFAMCFVFIFGFLALFNVQSYTNFYTGETTYKWTGYIGLLILIFGPICIRLIYETIMMFILAIKNIIEINNKLKDQNGSPAPRAPSNAAPQAPQAPFKAAPQAPQAPQNPFYAAPQAPQSSDDIPQFTPPTNTPGV